MKHFLIIATLLSIFVACEKEPLEEELPEPTEQTSMDEGTMIRMASFEDRVHPTSGEARILKIDESYFLELKDFQTDNGPALKVYLSSEENPRDFIDLGDLKATSGTFNYEIGADLDLETYPLVLIWCERFSVLFGVAEFE